MSDTKDTILDNKMLAEGFTGDFGVNKTYNFTYFWSLSSNQEAFEPQSTIFLRGDKRQELPAGLHNFPSRYMHVMFIIVLISVLIRSLYQMGDSLTYLFLAANDILQPFQAYQKALVT